MSGIDALLKRFDTQALDGLHELLVGPLAQFDVCGDNVLDYVGNLPVRDGRSQQCTKLGPLVGTAAEGDLVELLVVFLDAQNTDVAHVMVAAGVDAARNIDVQPAEIPREIEIAETT